MHVWRHLIELPIACAPTLRTTGTLGHCPYIGIRPFEPSDPVPRGRIPQDATVKQRMDWKLRINKGW